MQHGTWGGGGGVQPHFSRIALESPAFLTQLWNAPLSSPLLRAFRIGSAVWHFGSLVLWQFGSSIMHAVTY